MTKHRRLFVSIIVLALLVFTIPTFAQRGDRDGDGVPDDVDGCPAVPGPRENGGCPLPGSGGGDNPPDGSNDRDGDGVADFVDGCPDQPGTGFTNGCPVEETQPDAPPNAPPQLPPQVTFTWGSYSICLVGVAPTYPYNVNVREQASTSSPVLGQLAPGQQFAPSFVDYDENGDLWFGGAPVGDSWGWVAGFVMIDNGQCDNLPLVIPVNFPYQPQIGLTLDPDQLWEEAPYLEHHLTNVAISTYSLDEDDAPAPGGGVMTTDDWNVNEYPMFFNLMGNITVPPNPAMIVKFHDYVLSSYQSSASNDTANNGDPALPEYQNTFFAIPASLDGESLQPLVLFKMTDADVPDESCASAGEGFCVLSVLLLPAFGDAPGQCAPGAFSEAMLAGFGGRGLDIAAVDGETVNTSAGDGDTDGRDFLIWQRNLGSDAAGNLPKLGEYAINGNALGLLLPAVQAARQAAANEVQLKNASSFVSNTGDEAAMNSSEPEPGAELVVMGDGSVIPVETMPLNFANAARDRSCAMVAGVPGAGAYDWFLLLPALPAA